MKKNPSVEITTRAAQALQSGVSPSMLHRHLGVTPTYADRREATVRPSGRAVTVYEFGLPRGPHAALAVVTGQRAGEYEVFLARSGERELPVAGGKVALSGSVAARRNPRMKYIDELAESMVNAEAGAIKKRGPASAACLSEHGAWGHVYDVLTYLYGHGMESIARRFTEGIISGDLGAVHLDDRVLGKPAVGRNMQNKVSGAQAARAFRALRELCASKRTCVACKGSGQLRGQTCSWCGGTGGGARTNGGMAPFGGDMGYGRMRFNPISFEDALRANLSPEARERRVAVRVTSSGVAYINFYNLPEHVVAQKLGGGAEAENNRAMFTVDPVAAGKVKVTTVVSVFPQEYKVRTRTATIEQAAQHLAEGINRIVRDIPPNYTHTRTNGPGAPSMFNNMSDVLQGNVPRRNPGPFKEGDRVHLKDLYWTGMGAQTGTVTSPGLYRTLVRFDDGVLVDMDNRALLPTATTRNPKRRNFGDGPPPPPPVGNPRQKRDGFQLVLMRKDGRRHSTTPYNTRRELQAAVQTAYNNDLIDPDRSQVLVYYGGRSVGKAPDETHPMATWVVLGARRNPLRANHHLHPGDRVSMGAFVGTVDQQLPGTYDTYRVQWDRGGIDRVEGHKLRKL